MDCKCQIYLRYPVQIGEDDEDIYHCICENCGNEWVE
jgi:hypothetical protein